MPPGFNPDLQRSSRASRSSAIVWGKSHECFIRSSKCSLYSVKQRGAPNNIIKMPKTGSSSCRRMREGAHHLSNTGVPTGTRSDHTCPTIETTQFMPHTLSHYMRKSSHSFNRPPCALNHPRHSTLEISSQRECASEAASLDFMPSWGYKHTKYVLNELLIGHGVLLLGVRFKVHVQPRPMPHP